MPRPSTMTDWWKAMLEARANNSVALLAQMLKISVRTLHRWQTKDIVCPDLERRKLIQRIAGPELLARPDCPKYLRFKIVKKPVAAPVPAPVVKPALKAAPPKRELTLAEILRGA